MKKIYTTSSPRGTEMVASRLARSLKSGTVLGLEGTLGTGKTVFAKGIAKGLGIKQVIHSPTFIVMDVYPVRKRHIKVFVHVDCYRLRDVEDVKGIGLEDYYKDPHAVVVIEWADKVKHFLPSTIVWIHMRRGSTRHKRTIVVSG